MTAPRIAAHLIVGPREEPFLGALLESLADAAGMLVVNDNAPEPSPHAAVLAASRFSREGRMVVDRTPFTTFADARNLCMRIHEERAAGDWVAFVDADEVHAEAVSHVARNLCTLPAAYDFVDGYTWHFFQSFDWYTAIERRMMFFRFRPGVRWEGAVHETLAGLNGARVALPYVYAHYGHTLEPRRHAEKNRLYAALGKPGFEILREDQLDDFDVAAYFAPFYPHLLHFSGDHPPAARETIARLALRLGTYHQLTDRIARSQPFATKMRNVLMQLNYEQRWRARAFNPLARALLNRQSP
ncbi:MAG TPA: glycosyltransferase [Candidatus Baltobacteraceae bacterium]|nr:glycosyltransferase [Candidatus Baltobacteraceae bacterium]